MVGLVVGIVENGKSRRGKRSRPSSKQSAYLIKMNEIKEKRSRKREKEEGKLVKTEPLLSSLKSIDLSKNLITGVGLAPSLLHVVV